ncbi:hypothetical protein PPACK8108_LOCUS16181 [Phakopsora pachyrhizi]|uniref:Uncharacterized protein n=1 Tax=Phakopsora pachyrhizi TaxID=170000 RepID=A0AAV0BCP4_PHAPC|nr:hypothetical protein PPACK8108_LOCUS16181 [Phakopsora pachyrhizi]
MIDKRMINKQKGKGKLFDERKAEGGRRFGEWDELKNLSVLFLNSRAGISWKSCPRTQIPVPWNRTPATSPGKEWWPMRAVSAPKAVQL